MTDLSGVDMTHDTDIRVVTDNRFAIVPHWIIFSQLSDGAVRLYLALMKYADGTTKQAFPSRAALAADINKTTKTVDRYLKELEELGAVRVQRRRRAGSKENMSSLYTLVTNNPHSATTSQETCEPHSEPQSPSHATTASAPEVAPQVSPRSPTDVAGNYTHLTKPTITSIAVALDDADLTPAPSGAGRTLPEQIGVDKPQAGYLVDWALKLYREQALYTEGSWEEFIDIFIDLTGVDIGDAVANRRWDERLWEIVNDQPPGNQRYGASKWIAMLHNYSK